MKLTYMIIDDERMVRASLAGLLEKYCPDFIMTGAAASAAEARLLLAAERPDVIFCDIHMPGESGFEFLERIDVSSYHIVFVTAYSEYALRAFKARAFDYLLKPIDTEELKTTTENLKRSVLEKRAHREKQAEYHQSVLALVGELQSSRQTSGKICIHHATGISFIAVENICFLEGNGAYTTVHLADGRHIIASRILSEFEQLLQDTSFLRIHKSTIINLYYVKEYSRTDGFSVTLANGVQLTVGRRRVQDVLDRFHRYARSI